MSRPSDAQSSVSITMRLIISGVASSATVADLTARFASFGTVRDMEGLGMLDGNGDPRKFAYLTLETTQPKLTKCISALNGTKWKGSKLRVGEAKPRWDEKISAVSGNLKRSLDEKSSEDNAEPTPKKKKKKSPDRDDVTVGKQSGDMSITTLKNVESRKNWNRTPLDHLIRPLRMRPDHPLPLIAIPKVVPSASATKTKPEHKSGKNKVPTTLLTRARRTVIDPTRYGAVHITAASSMLGAEVIGYDIPRQKQMPASNQSSTLESSSSSSSSDDSDTSELDSGPETTLQHLTPKVPGPIKSQSPMPTKSSKPSSTSKLGFLAEPPKVTGTGKSAVAEGVVAYDEAERRRDLDIMGSLLDGKDTLTWEPDSDLEELARAQRDLGKSSSGSDSDSESESTSGSSPDDSSDEGVAGGSADVNMEPTNEQSSKSVAPAVHMTSLKAMFAPKPDEAGFSIFANLSDVDVDLEDLEDLDLNEQEPVTQVKSAPVISSLPPTVETTSLFDPNAPFFFSLPRDENGIANLPGDNRRGPRPRDLIDVLKVEGWNATTGASGGFWRTETDEEIRKQWEESREHLSQLTRRRHRDAVRRKRRHAGPGRGEGE
ncbi:hypothetical protein FRB94_009638 [Tulasnella sp. JGI-2019a]|nr:hypothetical protein FRB94_009638 [Tulasnella sp. JGI-2019a]